MRALAPVLAVALVLAGCVASVLKTSLSPNSIAGDLPVSLPLTGFYNKTGHPSYFAWEGQAVPFHKLEEIAAHVENWSKARPDLVDVRVFGKTIQGRPMWDVVVTNKSRPGPKIAPFIDGGHHANEIAGTELALYTVDLLLDNYGKNATITRWIDTMEIHTVPLVNPDGYVVQTRGNALGVNLNRNYDIDWGNPLGANNAVMGTLAHATGAAMPSVPIVAENGWNAPFSEPETRAMRDLLAGLDRRMAFYLTYHTPTHGFIAPWAAYKGPFKIPENESRVLEAELQWVRTKTEYAAGKAEWGNTSAGLPYSASGSSMDWAYMRHHVPAFTLELEIWYLSLSSSPDRIAGHHLAPYEGLEFWLKTALPIPLQLLANAEKLHDWQVPTVDPPLPAGVPPKFPASAGLCPAIPGDEAPGRPALPYPVECATVGHDDE